MPKEINWLKNKNQYSKKYIRILIFAVPIFLYAVPLNWIKEQHSLCIYKNLFGTDCYGCGITKSVLCMLHLQFKEAFFYNKLIVIVFPLLCYQWLRSCIKFISNA